MTAEFYVLRIFPQLKKSYNKTKIRAREDYNWNGEEQRRGFPLHKAFPAEGQRRGLPLGSSVGNRSAKKTHSGHRENRGEPCAFGLRGRHTAGNERQENVPVLAGPAAAGGPIQPPLVRGDDREFHGRGVLWTLQETWPGLPRENRELSDHLRPTRTGTMRGDKEEMLRICRPTGPRVEGRLGS